MITQTHDLNLIPGSVPPVVNVTQYDKTARTLVFNLWDGETSFSVPSGAAVTIRGTKPDGNGFEYKATASGSAVSMNIQQQMATCAGSVRCEVRITSGTQILGTADFILAVKPSALNENTPLSETDLPIFEQLVSDAQTAASEAQAAATSVSAILPASSGTPGQVLTKTATAADWQDVSCPFPIGFGGFFQSDPNSIYAGTTWAQKKDVFILAAGDTYPAGSTGGEAQHTLTVDEMPWHNHSEFLNISGIGKVAIGGGTTSGTDLYEILKSASQGRASSGGGPTNTGHAGGGAAHNNMPPYFSMPFWIRTA